MPAGANVGAGASVQVPALELRGITKRFGDRQALRGLSFVAPRGAITGLVGPNGAGKTTCFSIVGSFLQPDAGEVNVLGRGAYRPGQMRGLLGMLPQDSELPPHARLHLYLRYMARLQGLDATTASRETDRVLDELSLSDRKHARVRELSHGMRRRVSVAQALLGSPPLLLLDEPTSGLDPSLVADMRTLLLELRDRRNASLIVSSHVLSDLEAVCDHVVFMDKGRCIRAGSLTEVTGQSSHVRIRVAHMPTAAELRALALPGELTLEDDELVIALPPGQDATETTDAWLRALLEHKAGIVEVRRGESLERAFLARARGTDGAR